MVAEAAVLDRSTTAAPSPFPHSHKKEQLRPIPNVLICADITISAQQIKRIASKHE
jgi:hypothetical protein